jgi:transposase
MRLYREYVPEQAFLLPPSLAELIPEGDPVFFLREVIERLDLEAFHRSYQAERGQPPYHPQLMAGLYLYGAMRQTYSSRRLAELCQRDVACMYLVGRATPDYHTIGEFRQRFTAELKGLFLQVLLLCREAGLVRLGHISLDGTKVRANASKHKAMSYGRMLQKEPVLAAEVERWLDEGRRQDAGEDAEYGQGDDGWSLPEEMKETRRRLEKIREGKARLEEVFRQKAVTEGRAPGEAQVPERAQTNFTDPESRIMNTTEGFQQCYNAQAAVDATNQIIVGATVTQAANDNGQLLPVIDAATKTTKVAPKRVLADAGYKNEADLAKLISMKIDGYIAVGREGKTASKPKKEQPHTAAMRARLKTKRGRERYRKRKSIVEPVFGWVKRVLGFRAFSLRGLRKVAGEWNLVCLALNLRRMARMEAAR